MRAGAPPGREVALMHKPGRVCSCGGDLEALRREDCVTTRRATAPEAAWWRAVMAGVA